jgi:hypothetical protein
MSSTYKDIYKLIDNLKIRIKKLDTLRRNSYFIKSYNISLPTHNNKIFIGLLFDENFNDFCTNSENSNTKISFIKLKGSTIINYSLLLLIDKIPEVHTICSICFGIKTDQSKVRIIKGSKYIFDISNKNNLVNNQIIINNTIIYSANMHDELCMIAVLHDKCKIITKKSIIKVYTI